MFKGNKIYKIDKQGNKKRVFWIPGIRIKFKGRNSTITIAEPAARFINCRILCGDNCKVSIGPSKNRIKKLKIFLNDCDNSQVNIGNNFHLTNGCEMILNPENNLSINIGNDCKFAKDIAIRATDAHLIRDINSGKIINYGKSITIGNRVWLTANVTVLKGADISNDVIVATNSTVTKGDYNSNSIYAGSPAKLVKTGITWQVEAPSIELDNITQFD